MTNCVETDSRMNSATQRSLAAAATASGHERAFARLRAFFVRRRTFLGMIVAFVLVAVAEPTPVLLLAGAALMALAHVLRIVCTGYLNKDETLVTAGPFGWCRNPLYWANFFVVVAFAVMSGRLVALPVMLFLWLVTHAWTVAYEEEFLRDKFGEEFDRYCRRVARWTPRRPNCPGTGEFSWHRVIANGEHLNVISAWIVAAMFLVEMVK